MGNSLVAFGILLTPVLAWTEGPLAGNGPSPTTQPAWNSSDGGFWPSEVLVETLLRRWAGAASDIYELSPKQRAELETQLLDRWPTFLNENRGELQPLLNEYLEARLAADAPSARAARRLAHRALPQLEKLSECLAEGNDQFAALLTGVQRKRFEDDRAELAAELERLAARLQAWERNEFQPQQWWELTRPVRAKPRTNEGEPKPPPAHTDEFDLEITAWDRFVREFIEKYDLDDAQRRAAESILLELKARARDHYHAHRLRIAAMEELIRYPKAGTTEAEIEAELIQLYGPIDAMFAELGRRLNLIPTEAQKCREAERPQP